MRKLKLAVWESLFLAPPLAPALFASRFAMRLVFKGKFALGDLDARLKNALGEEAGYFVEIGGNDGITQSNTKRLELFGGWKGLLVEPDSKNYSRMLITRGKETCKVEGACVPFGYEDDYVELEYSNLMTVARSLNLDLNDIDGHLDSGRKWLFRGSSQRRFQARAYKLQDLLTQCGAPKVIDFFSLDVEGAELAVLQGVDLTEFRFKNLMIETRSPDRVSEYLAQYGYSPEEKMSSHDFLFKPTQDT